MFWTDIEAGSIERAYMDSNERNVLADNVGWANGITVDYARRVIIWIGKLKLGLYDLSLIYLLPDWSIRPRFDSKSRILTYSSIIPS